MLLGVTGSRKSKMAATKQEVLISRLVDKIATKFQRLHPCFRGLAVVVCGARYHGLIRLLESRTNLQGLKNRCSGSAVFWKPTARILLRKYCLPLWHCYHFVFLYLLPFVRIIYIQFMHVVSITEIRAAISTILYIIYDVTVCLSFRQTMLPSKASFELNIWSVWFVYWCRQEISTIPARFHIFRSGKMLKPKSNGFLKTETAVFQKTEPKLKSQFCTPLTSNSMVLL
jgi:hypothetical protein